MLRDDGLAVWKWDPFAKQPVADPNNASDGDILIAYSKAGKSAEINHFVQVTKQRGGRVISLTWEPESELGKLSDITLVVRSGERAEGEGILPFGSTLAAGAVSDVLCQMVKLLRGFDLATLVQTHPSGATAERTPISAIRSGLSCIFPATRRSITWAIPTSSRTWR